MSAQQSERGTVSRRRMLTGSATILTAGAVGAATGAIVGARPAVVEAPPLPWKWVKLDPLEAGRRAYRNYMTKGGCGSATYIALLSLLKEKVGHPYTTLPDMMMIHAGSGYGGHGTLCGALGGSSLIINLVTYDGKSNIYQQMIDRLFYWYAEQEFPTSRFDDICAIPKQVKVKAMSPLCHTSVSKWTLTAGAKVSSKDKKDRCAKVAGEVVYTVTTALNEYFEGKWTPPAWKPSKGIEHCLACHGPDNMEQSTEGMNNQQGHMECLMCHTDHTK
jgi:hypothetical protein